MTLSRARNGSGPTPSRVPPQERLACVPTIVTAVGAATRVVADLLDRELGQPLDAIVIGTLWGDPGCAGDPLGGMRRAVHRGFVSAQRHTSWSPPGIGRSPPACGSREPPAQAMTTLRLGWRSSTGTPPVEIGIALLLSRPGRHPDRRSGANPVLDATPSAWHPAQCFRRSPPSRRGTRHRAEAKQTAVMLDRGPRDGIAWTTVVGS